MSSLGDGTNSDMNVMISEVKNLRNSIKSQINAETSGKYIFVLYFVFRILHIYMYIDIHVSAFVNNGSSIS